MIVEDRGNRADRDLISVIDRIRNATTLIFDVDGTLVRRQQGLEQSLAKLLLRSGKTLGIATSRAGNELDEVFPSPNARDSLFTGPVVLEDGGVVIHGGKTQLRVSSEQATAVFRLRDALIADLAPQEENNPWLKMPGGSGPLIQIPSNYTYQTSFSIWQQISKGSLTNDHLKQTMDWCQAVVERLEISGQVQLLEIGDGTLRVSTPGQSKGAALHSLHKENSINLARTAYFGDGANDVEAARWVKYFGGTVIAADTRCTELTDIADFSHLSLRGPDLLEYLFSRLVP